MHMRDKPKGRLSTAGEAVKRAVGVEGDFKETVLPMLTYNAANIGMAGASQVSGEYLLSFRTYAEGLSLGTATLSSFLRSIWDAVIDPFIGFAVDRTRSRLGKHRLYIILMAVPFGLSYAMQWTSFGISARENPGIALAAWHLAAGMLFALFSSILDISHSAMLPTLATGYFERTQYTSVGYIMNSVGMGPAQLFGVAMVGFVSTREFDAAVRPTLFKMGLAVGLVAIVPILFTGLATRESSSKNEVFPPLNVRAFFHEFKLVLENRAFRQYFSMTFLYLFGSTFFSVSRPFFLREIARRWDMNSQLVTVRGIFEMCMFPINFALTKKFGKQKCAHLTMPLLFVAFALGFLILPQAEGSRAIPVVIMLFAREIFYIMGYSGYGFMISNIYPDVTDVDEMITGRRREATMSTFNSFVKTMVSGFMASVVGIMLEWFGVGEDRTTVSLFSARAADISGALTNVVGLRLSNALLPLVFLGLALISLRKFKMTRQDHELIRRAVAQRHEEGAAEVDDTQRAKLEEIAGKPWCGMWVSGAALAGEEEEVGGRG
jgi:Na+/melibiose symporter-like transporter